MSTEPVYRKGFGLGESIAPQLERDYHSALVSWFREHDFRLQEGNTTILLAREFGFCYGVDRAVEYAYETREQFPDRRIFLSGEIIHNPEVNGRIESLGIRILPDHRSPQERYEDVEETDVLSGTGKEGAPDKDGVSEIPDIG